MGGYATEVCLLPVMEIMYGPRRTNHPPVCIIVVITCFLLFFPPRGRQPSVFNSMAQITKCGGERVVHDVGHPWCPFPARRRTRKSWTFRLGVGNGGGQQVVQLQTSEKSRRPASRRLSGLAFSKTVMMMWDTFLDKTCHEHCAQGWVMFTRNISRLFCS